MTFAGINYWAVLVAGQHFDGTEFARAEAEIERQMTSSQSSPSSRLSPSGEGR